MQYSVVDVAKNICMRDLNGRTEVGMAAITFIGLFGSEPNDLYVDDKDGNRTSYHDFEKGKI